MNFIENESAEKLRGGYYTPPDIAAFVSRWVFNAKPSTVLEPSCGDGAFIQAISDIGVRRTFELTGFELFPEEATKSRARAQSLTNANTKIYSDDFLGWALDHVAANRPLFDAVVGNPPFIRYQYLPVEAQSKAELIFRKLSLPFTKHTNAWVPFVLASIDLLKPGGRLGMVLPAEIINVIHAQSLRTFLGQQCRRLSIVDPTEIWFDKTLQGAIILLAEKRRTPDEHIEGLGMIRVSGRAFAQQCPESLLDGLHRLNGQTIRAKWTHAFLTQQERQLFDALRHDSQVHRFRDIAEVDVGIVTGANKFFLVDDETVRRYKLQTFAHPMFGRSNHCPGVVYDLEQHKRNAESGLPTNLIWLKGDKAKFGKSVRQYIELGEAQRLHTRYKCRVRSPWYTVPSVYPTSIGMLKRAHDTPRLILNKMRAYTTDTAYRIRSKTVNEAKLVYFFCNPLTALSAEIEGRHYGGGVLELVPSEIEKLLIPVPSKLRPAPLSLDKLVRSTSAEDYLAQQAIKVLGAIGLNRNNQVELVSAWLKLRNRRHRKVVDQTT